MRRLILCFIALAILCVSNLTAQRAPQGQWTHHRVADPSALLQPTFVIHSPSVDDERPDPVLNGIFIGAALGGAAGFVVLGVLTHGDAYPTRSIPFGAVVGGLIGWLVDASQ